MAPRGYGDRIEVVRLSPGEALRQKRVGNCVEVGVLAAAAGVQPSQVCNVEDNRCQFRTLCAVAAALGSTVRVEFDRYALFNHRLADIASAAGVDEVTARAVIDDVLRARDFSNATVMLDSVMRVVGALHGFVEVVG